MQHLQSQAAEEMKFLASQSQKEAIAMRVIAFITMVYLPATFVSVSFDHPTRYLNVVLRQLQTFFSTDVIKYQNGDQPGKGDGTYSSTAMMRWLQVSLPLTFVTFGIVFIMYYVANRRRKAWFSVGRQRIREFSWPRKESWEKSG